MKRVTMYIFLLTALLSLGACSDSGTGLMTPASSGRAYEMLVVMNDSLWNRPAGRALFDALDTDVPGLPQSERSFRIMQINESQYNRTFGIFRNIIIPKIDRMYTQAKFKYSRDVHASPQMIMTIQAPNEQAFADYVNEHKQTIVDFFTRAEMNRQVKELEKDFSEGTAQRVKDMFGYEIRMPSDVGHFYKSGKDFLWETTYSHDLNLILYTYPFTDKETFTEEFFVRKRDSVMRANPFGPADNSYMSTYTPYLVSKDIAVRGKYAQEIKGLWEMKNAVMGGPYVSHVRVDEEKGLVVVAEVFIFAPEKKKRDIMRRMEAALYTLKLPNDISTNTTQQAVEGIEEEKVETDATR